jgi:16S rRNA G966 N2-methylase RsmD
MENYFDTNKREKFDLIFFDPPFADNEFIKNLNLIKKNLMYCPDHLIIIHREKIAEDNLDDFINVIIKKRYGRSQIFFGNFI